MVFKYLSRILSMHNINAHVVHAHLLKTRSYLNHVRKIFRGENASPCMCGKFWKSIVQSVLLYCSETWALTPALLRRLEEFQLLCAYKLA